MNHPPKSITAFSLANGLGCGRDAVEEALFAGRTGLVTPPFALPFETFVGAIPGKLPELPPSIADYRTRTAQIASLLVSEIAPELRRARERYAPHRIAVLLGTSTAGAEATESAFKHYVAAGSLPDDYDVFKHHTYGAVLHVFRELSGARGPSFMVSTACTSSAKPLATASRLLDAGVIDAALVGGVDTLCEMTLMGFHSLDALSNERAKPFSSERRGLNIGEGGALLLVERSGDAMALLEGVGESSDAYHISAPHPEGLGAKLAMERALAFAGVEPSEVDHINAHGTGTQLNDKAESRAIVDLFGREIPVISTKGYTGHTLGAAGATEAIFSIMTLLRGEIPASLFAGPVDPAVEARIVLENERSAPRRVLSNSFAFGGNNISVCLRAV